MEDRAFSGSLKEFVNAKGGIESPAGKVQRKLQPLAKLGKGLANDVEAILEAAEETTASIGLEPYNVGDTIYASSLTSLTKLSIGTLNKVMTSSGTAPRWSSSLELAGTLDVTGQVVARDALTVGLAAFAATPSDTALFARGVGKRGGVVQRTGGSGTDQIFTVDDNVTPNFFSVLSNADVIIRSGRLDVGAASSDVASRRDFNVRGAHTVARFESDTTGMDESVVELYAPGMGAGYYINLGFRSDTGTQVDKIYGSIGALLVSKTGGAEKGDLVFYVADGTGFTSEMWRMTNVGHLVSKRAAGNVVRNDVDTISLGMAGGSENNDIHSAFIELFGASHATSPGVVTVRAANVVGGVIDFVTGGANRWRIDKGGNLVSQRALGNTIRNDTVDGADDQSMDLTGGGASGDVTRGSFVRVHGNEHLNTGEVVLVAGNVSGGQIVMATGNAIRRWRVTDAGHLFAETDSTYDIGDATGSGTHRPRDFWLGRNFRVAGVGEFIGNVGVGAGNNAAVGLYVRSAALTSIDQYGVYSAPVASSAATNSSAAYVATASTAAAAFTCGQAMGLRITDAVKGAGSTITGLIGLYVDAQTQGGTNYAIYTNAGLVRFGDDVALASGKTLSVGTHSAIGAETVTGFITIKDAGGTSRKLAVVS